jgi:uncharacterized protein YijF (DUF1287 family)
MGIIGWRTSKQSKHRFIHLIDDGVKDENILAVYNTAVTGSSGSKRWQSTI